MAETTSAQLDTPSPAEKIRNPVLDGLKYAAAGAIVLHHTAAYARSYGSVLGAFLVAVPVAALFFFFAVSGYFHGELGNRGWKWLRQRVVRLGVPYIVWSAFYMLWRNRHMIHGAPPSLPKTWELIFFAGAHGILWSLAMLLYCAIVIELFVHTATQRRIALAIAVVGTLAVYWLVSPDVIATSSIQNFLLGPRWFIAYLGGMEIRAIGPRKTPGWFYEATVIASMLVVGVFRLENPLFSSPVIMTVETALWVVGALLILQGATSGTKWFGVSRLAWGRDYLVGIYVSHVLFLEIIASSVPPTLKLYGAPWIIAAWAFCMLMSTVTVAILRSNRVTRWAVD